MAERKAKSDTSDPVGKDSGARPPATGDTAAAMRELADAIRVLATAITETAVLPEFEFVPCEEAAASGDADGDREPCARMLPLIPTPRGENRVDDADEGALAEDGGALCRPGGCGCNEPDIGLGRHARRGPVEAVRLGSSGESVGR